jgi:presequence protease
VDNPHRTTVLLTPDPTVRQAQEAKEAERLQQAKAAMTAADVQQVMAQANELKRLQETPDSPEALATLPMLTLADLDKTIRTVPNAVTRAEAETILYHDLFTNGIVYLDLGFDLHTLPQHLLPYVPLFCDCLTRIGTEREDFVKIAQRIGQKTGGVWVSPLVSSAKDGGPALAWLVLRAKATLTQASDMLALVRDLLLTVRLDNQERFKQMVLETKSQQESSVIPGGHAMVNTRLRAHFDEGGWLDEIMDGVEGLFFTRKLADEVAHNWPAVVEHLDEIRRIFLNRRAMVCNVTLDQENWQRFEPQLRGFLEQIPALDVERVTWTPQPPIAFEGLTIPARVNFVAKGARLYDLGYQFHGSTLAIQNYLRTTWLWEQVRVRGGAYGGFCTFDRYSGVFAYLSYRDPNLLGTLDAYDQAARFLKDADISRDELTKSIIGAVGQLDAYQLPDAKGYTEMVRYLLGITTDERQRIRDELLGTQPQDFKAFADVLAHINDRGLVVVMGSKEAIDEANAARNNWLTTLKVL